MAYRPGIDAPVMASKAEPAVLDKEIGFIKSLQSKLLGELPEEATSGADMFDAGVASVKRASTGFTDTLERRTEEMTQTLRRAATPVKPRTIAYFDQVTRPLDEMRALWRATGGGK